MSFLNLLRDRIQIEATRRYVVLRVGVESALMGLIIALGVLVFTSLLGLSDTIQGLCFPLLFAALVIFGGLAGFNSHRRGIEERMQVAFAGGVCGICMGLLLGILTGVLNVLIPFQTTARLVTADTQIAPTLGSYLLPALAFCSLTSVLAFLGTIVGSLSAVLTKASLDRAGITTSSETQQEGMRLRTEDPLRESDLRFLPGMEDVPGQLRPALRAIYDEEPDTARAIIAKYLLSDLESEAGWLLLTYVLEDPVKKQESLERVLGLNPESILARRMQEHMRASVAVEQAGKVPAYAKAPREHEDRSFAVGEAELRKRSLTITGIGAAVTALIPLMVMLFDRYELSHRMQPTVVIFMAMILSYVLGHNLLKGESPKRERMAAAGAINGVMVALVTLFTSALAYHTVFLPMNRNHTRVQGIIAWIADGIFGAVFLGALLGAGGALAAYFSSPVSRWLQARIRAAARDNAWAAVWLAISSHAVDRRDYFLDQALALEPSNPAARLVKHLQKSTTSEHATEGQGAGIASILNRIPLPPWITTETGRRFLFRAGVSFGVLLSCSVCANLLNVGGDILNAVTTLVVILAILLVGGFLVWSVVQVLKSG